LPSCGVPGSGGQAWGLGVEPSRVTAVASQGGLVYRAEGSTYVLYSAGLDNTDDGGKVPAKEGERFHPLGRDREGKGYDYMLGAPKKE
jgi:hypothetical protein